MVKNWLGREALLLIQTLTWVEQESCETVTGLLKYWMMNTDHSIVRPYSSSIVN